MINRGMGNSGSAATRTRHNRRVTSVAVWDASPGSARPIRWSGVAPAVLAQQTVVAVEISGEDGGSVGVASLTHYVEPELSLGDGRFDASLVGWLGRTVQGLPDPEAANPYDPSARPLRAPIELAALDALGRQTGLPAAAFLGGVCRNRIEAYASLPSFESPSAAVACACAAIDAGFRAVKFHASGSLECDLATIATARKELGPNVSLMWDASCAYELYSAVVVGTALAQSGYLWFEAPLTDESTEALRALARRASIPLVPDGLVQRSSADWARDVRDGVWGALRLDVTRTPGVSSALQLLRLSETLGLPCEIQSFGYPLSQYSNLQLMLATNACRFFEAPFPTADFEDGLVQAPPLVDGFVLAPELPGLGHGIDRERLTEYGPPLAHVSL